MVDTFEEIIHGMGGRVLGDKPGKEQDYGLLAPGRIIHEVGTARHGQRPQAGPGKRALPIARLQKPLRRRRLIPGHQRRQKPHVDDPSLIPTHLRIYRQPKEKKAIYRFIGFRAPAYRRDASRLCRASIPITMKKTNINRRDSLKLMGAASLAGLTWTSCEPQTAITEEHEHVHGDSVHQISDADPATHGRAVFHRP